MISELKRIKSAKPERDPKYNSRKQARQKKLAARLWERQAKGDFLTKQQTQFLKTLTANQNPAA